MPQLKWADVVVWLVAVVGDGACAVNPDLSVEINQKEVEFLSKNFDGRIIYMSTCSVYGASDGILTEESKCNPLSVDASTKLKSEGYLKDKNALIFRLGTLFGKSDDFSRLRLDLVVNILTAKAHYNKKLTVFGGKQYRPLLHVFDVANAIVDNLDTEHIGVYNIAYKNMTIIEVAKQIKSYFDNVEIDITEQSFEDSRNYQVSWDKAQKILDFKTKYTLNDGIQELKYIFEENRIKGIDNGRYNNHSFLKSYLPK